MSPLDRALAYAAIDMLPVFPCIPSGPKRKNPFTAHGFENATRDEAQLKKWWRRWPDALIGLRTGRVSRRVVLDVDVKRSNAHGFETLDDLGFAILPVTAIAHTPSGGLHLHFDPAGREIPSTQGTKGRGIGAGLDWRGEGGYVILPSPGSGYFWDPSCGPDTPLARVPVELLPRAPEQSAARAKPVQPVTGLSPYGEEALDRACRAIIAAPSGEQEATINGEAFSIGTLAGAGGIPEGFARRALLWAAQQIPSYDPRRPWHPLDIERKVDRAFTAGLDHPRTVHRYG